MQHPIDIRKRKVYNLEVNGPHEYFANDILVSNCDALLYNWRFCLPYLASAKPTKLKMGTDEYFREQAEDMYKQEEYNLKKKASQDPSWMEGPNGWDEGFDLSHG